MGTATGVMLAAMLLNGWALPTQAQTGFGPIYGRPSPPPSACPTDDLSCRIQVLERRLNDLEARGGEGSRGDRPGRGRSVDMSVERDCIFDSCTSMASKLCTDAGFARGVAAEVRQNGGYQRLVRASCLD